MESLRTLLDRALHPGQGFAERAREAPELAEAVRAMVLLRSPVSFIGLVLGYVGFGALYTQIATPGSSFWSRLPAELLDRIDPAELQAGLARLPALPSLHAALPALVLLAPVMVLSLWMHDVAFDHMALWMLGGLKTGRGVRATCVADAEALKVGVLGAALGLLSELPVVGWVLGLLLFPVGIWFWVLRGHALAAWHGCPVWKGVVATLLHVLLATVMVVALIGMCVAMVFIAL